MDAAAGWRLRATFIAPAAVDLATATPWRVFVDADAVGEPLLVRPPRPGDRLQPLGLKGIKKLHDVLIDLKVPRAERARVRLVESPRGIVWAVGLRLADWARLTPDTRRVLRLEVIRDA